jgi:hypothetical protein
MDVIIISEQKLLTMQNQSRRNFLKSGTLLGASVVTAATLNLVPSNANASTEKGFKTQKVKPAL